jgi:hypothetical protein
MPGRQRIGEIAPRPGKGINARFRRSHRIEIRISHFGITHHYFTPPRAIRSAVVKATLSRT